jgi:hypothetical protein
MMHWAPGPAHPMQLVMGLGLWCVWFVAMYAGLSLACVASASSTSAGVGLNALLLIVTALTIALLGYWMWRCILAARHPPRAHASPQTARFIALVSAVLHGSALLSTLFVALPLWQLPPCV